MHLQSSYRGTFLAAMGLFFCARKILNLFTRSGSDQVLARDTMATGLRNQTFERNWQSRLAFIPFKRFSMDAARMFTVQLYVSVAQYFRARTRVLLLFLVEEMIDTLADRLPGRCAEFLLRLASVFVLSAQRWRSVLRAESVVDNAARVDLVRCHRAQSRVRGQPAPQMGRPAQVESPGSLQNTPTPHAWDGLGGYYPTYAVYPV
jgi:hypothetical protein